MIAETAELERAVVEAALLADGINYGRVTGETDSVTDGGRRNRT